MVWFSVVLVINRVLILAISVLCTVEPCLTTIPFIRPPHYYGHFSYPKKSSLGHCPIWRTPLIRPNFHGLKLVVLTGFHFYYLILLSLILSIYDFFKVKSFLDTASAEIILSKYLLNWKDPLVVCDAAKNLTRHSLLQVETHLMLLNNHDSKDSSI